MQSVRNGVTASRRCCSLPRLQCTSHNINGRRWSMKRGVCRDVISRKEDSTLERWKSKLNKLFLHKQLRLRHTSADINSNCIHSARQLPVEHHTMHSRRFVC